LALDKCKVYYAKLDDSGAILASSVLHPGRGWPFIKQLWKNKSQWVVAGKERVENLWLSQYAEEPAAAVAMPIAIPLNIMEEYRAQGFTQPPDRTLRSDLDDDYSRWLRRRPTTCSDPINWWSTAGASEYPRLARMALDLLTIPATSDEAECLFSRLALMITNRCNQLEQPTIQATQCLFSWDKAGIIDLEAAQVPAGPGIATP
jgi:hypothetical protein